MIDPDEKEQKNTEEESLSEEDDIIRIHCAENDDACQNI